MKSLCLMQCLLESLDFLQLCNFQCLFQPHDWDYFIGSDIVREDRECIIPDINRSYHWSTMGFHVKASFSAEYFYLSRYLNKEPNVKLQPVEK